MRRQRRALLTVAAWSCATAAAATAQVPLAEPGIVLTRTMQDDTPHEFRVAVQAGQAVRIRVTQLDMDVVVMVLDPQGQPVVEMDGPTGAKGDEDVTIVAAASGDHIVRVKPLNSPGGRYELRIEPPRTPTAEDRERAELHQLLFTSPQLLDSTDVGQRADVVRRIQRALAAARAAGDTTAVRTLYYRLLSSDPKVALESLDVPTIAGPVPVYYSRGHEARARDLQERLLRAVDYFAQRLEVRPTIVMAVLAREEWEALTAVPYGLPWSDGGRWASIVVLPATHAIFDEFASAIRQQPEAAAEVSRGERETGLSLEDGVRLAADAIMYHELGHIFSAAYGIGSPNLWFGEFVAGYFADAYQNEVVPDRRVTPFALVLGAWLDTSTKPTYTSLEDLERLYATMEPSNYGWYQAQFEKRGRAVYGKEGFGFIPRLKTALPRSDGEKLAVPEVLARLERISPGFVAWAEDLARLSR